MRRQTAIDHRTYARWSFVFGVALFAFGVLGHVAGPVLFGALPEWELTLLTVMEGAGILIALLSPFVFVVALPLVE